MRRVETGNIRFHDLKEGDEFKISSTHYSVVKSMAGGMGIVIFAEQKSRPSSFIMGNMSHGPTIVLKTVRSEILNDKTRKDFFSELYNWSKFSHPSILPLHEVLTGSGAELIALMDPMVGSLRDYIGTKKFTETEIKHIARSVLKGLEYASKSFHTNHLDIKPENLLVGPSLVNIIEQIEPKGDFRDNRILITDWGISSSKSTYITGDVILNNILNSNDTQNNSGTLYYMSPERFIKGFSSSEASDIYSLGIVIIELITGALPFNALDGSLDLDSLLVDKNISSKLKKLVLRMIAPNFSERISIKKALKAV